MRRSNLTAPTALRLRCSPPVGAEPEEASQATHPAPASSSKADGSEQEPAAGGGEGAAEPPQLEGAPPAPAPPVEAALRAYVQPPAEHAGRPAVHFMRRGPQLLHTAAEAEAVVTYVALSEGPTVDSLRQVRNQLIALARTSAAPHWLAAVVPVMPLPSMPVQQQAIHCAAARAPPQVLQHVFAPWIAQQAAGAAAPSGHAAAGVGELLLATQKLVGQLEQAARQLGAGVQLPMPEVGGGGCGAVRGLALAGVTAV